MRRPQIERLWRENLSPWAWPLWAALTPLSSLYAGAIALPRSRARDVAPIPVISVGNLTVGGNGKTPKEPRASTTDADARVMKMADAGFRPAYNVQVASAAGEQIIVAVKVENNGSDRVLMRPMLERLDAAAGSGL